MFLPGEAAQTKCSGDPLPELSYKATPGVHGKQPVLYFHQVPRQKPRLGNKAPDANSRDPSRAMLAHKDQSGFED